MKRFFYFLGTIALLASCSNSFEIERDDLPSRGGVEIKFKSYASAMTKAIDPRVPGTNIFGNNDTFLLWGLRYDNNSMPGLDSSSDSIPCNLYQRTPVLAKRIGTSLDWTPITDTVTFEPVKRYWNKNSKYIFAALSSATESLYCGMQFRRSFFATTLSSYYHQGFENHDAVCFAPGDSAYNSEAINRGITAIFSGHNNDLLVADAVFVNEVPESPGQVTLNFHHMASMIDVLIMKDGEITDSVVVKKIQIDSLRYVGIPGVFWDEDDVTNALLQEGTISVPPDTIIWCHYNSDQILGDNKYTSMDGSHGVSKKAIPEGGVVITSEADTLIGQLIVMPQPIEEDMTATIEYSIAHSGDYSITVPIAALSSGNTSWEPGRHYTYKLTITANKISLEPTIKPWETNN